MSNKIYAKKIIAFPLMPISTPINFANSGNFGAIMINAAAQKNLIVILSSIRLSVLTEEKDYRLW